MTQITLLLVLPTSWDDYIKRIASSDYLARLSGDPQAFWPHYLREVAEPSLRLAGAASGIGATVVENASLADLTRAMRGDAVVVLLSHWKGPEVVPEDLLTNDGLRFVSLVEREQDAAARQLARSFFEQSPKSAGDIRKILNAFVTCGDLGDLFGDGFRVSAQPFTLKTMRRDRLDALFAGLMRPGNRVEFADGLYSKQAVADAAPSDFTGLLDLTTCTSVVLSDHLSRASRGVYRTLQFEKAQEPALACLILERVFALMRTEKTYMAARRQALQEVTTFAAQGAPLRIRLWRRIWKARSFKLWGARA